MTAEAWPDHLLTLGEFVELPEDDSRRYELREGVPVASPRAAWLHQQVLLIDLTEPLSLTTYHRAGVFGHQEAPAVTGVFETQEPFPSRIDLTELPDGPEGQYAKDTHE